jgi:hypothetical protein
MSQETRTDVQADTESETTVETETGTGSWIGGVVAGLVGGAVMGVMLTMMMTPVIEMAIPALWGLQGGTAGWVIHMANSAVFGIVFAALLTLPGLRKYAGSISTSAVLGAVYGVVLWIVAAGVVMPIWLSAVGFPMAPPLPNFNPMSMVGHVVFGVILGAVYPYVRRL